MTRSSPHSRIAWGQWSHRLVRIFLHSTIVVSSLYSHDVHSPSHGPVLGGLLLAYTCAVHAEDGCGGAARQAVGFYATTVPSAPTKRQ